MMRKYLTYALKYAYIGLVVFVALAVPFSSLTAAERQFNEAAAADAKAEAEAPVQTELDRGAPDPDEAPDNMTPSGPCCNQPAYLQSVPLIKTTEKGDSDDLLDDHVSTAWPQQSDESLRRLTVSTWQVTSDLGIQFTLVGAKPSGTS